MKRLSQQPSVWVFAILWASSAYLWQGRDWNSASRLMLTYALVDRGTFSIDGLNDQTRDIARYQNHWYTDKTPGFSVAAILPYRLSRWLFGFPKHPLDRPGFAYWPADYWVTLGTSGLATAGTGAILAILAGQLGCGPRWAGILGLTYGLATPAAVYATLAYGHQLAAVGLFAAFSLIAFEGRRVYLRTMVAGFCAAYASVVEIQVGPVSAILGLAMIALVVARRLPVLSLVTFAVGAALPTALLLGYNQVAFDSPWRMGYFFLVMDRFKEVHSTDNPLGLMRPDLAKVRELLWGERRGLLWFAPILALAPIGLILLALKRRWALVGIITLILVAIFLVNLSYPEWTGGWTTGPRLLVPLLPFACLAVAPVLATRQWVGLAIAVSLGLVGWAEMTLFAGVGGRIPDAIARPFVDGVWPLWRGDPLPGWVFGNRFARNPVSLLIPRVERSLPSGLGGMMFLPLVGFQVVAIGLMIRCLPSARNAESQPPPTTDQAEAV